MLHVPDREEQYFFLAGCMLLFLLAVSTECALRWCPARVQAVLLLFIVAGGFAGNFAAPPFVDLRWREAAAQIEAWRTARAHHALVGGLTTPLNPESWAIHLPPTYRELTITGFPDHVIATPSGNAAAAFAIQGAAIRSSTDSMCIDLPAVLGIHEQYRLRAVVQTRGSATVSVVILLQLLDGISIGYRSEFFGRDDGYSLRKLISVLFHPGARNHPSLFTSWTTYTLAPPAVVPGPVTSFPSHLEVGAPAITSCLAVPAVVSEVEQPQKIAAMLAKPIKTKLARLGIKARTAKLL